MKTITRKELLDMAADKDVIDRWDKSFSMHNGNVYEFIQLSIERNDETKYDADFRVTDAIWLLPRCLTRKNLKKYAVYIAEQVIHIYKEQYPENKSIQKALDASRSTTKAVDNEEIANASAKAAKASVKASKAADKAINASNEACLDVCVPFNKSRDLELAAAAADAVKYAARVAAFADPCDAVMAINAAAYATKEPAKDLIKKALQYGTALL